MSLIDKWTKKKEKKQLDAVKQTADLENDPKKDTKEEQKKVTEKKETKTKGKTRAHAYRVLIRPMVSEKATAQEVHGKYTFVVACNAHKEDIKRAVEVVYGVRPVSVRTAQFEGKRKRFGIRRGKRKDWKKAMVTLPKGRTINIHEGV